MNLERYEVLHEPGAYVYGFVSEGPKGAFRKAVVFTRIIGDFYNLGFGDYDSETGEINYLSRPDNGDTELILTTVAAIVVAFTDEHPEATVAATGSTPERTRLYRMGITRFLDEMLLIFEVFGFRDGDWESFRRGVSYDGFYVCRKA